MRRRSLFIAIGALALTPTTAFADAAGPSDFQSRVISVEPAAAQVTVTVEGGDSFLMLKARRGTVVAVPGYEDEPFLRFEADGTVLENSASYTAVVSRSRYMGADPHIPRDTAPVWHEVAHDGAYAWHDHRIHWMSPGDPPGKRPGDVILRSQIPMVVDEVNVVVTVESVWLPAPSAVPAWLGGIAGLGVAAAAIALRRRRQIVAGLLVVDLAVLAVVVGWWQYHSLPTETGPRLVWFALPVVALAAAVARVALRNRLTAEALALLAGANLAMWGWERRDDLVRAVLPTNAPWWLDRAASAAALSGGVAIAAAALVALGTAVAAPQQLTSAS
jgi:hypothetical protein